MEVGTALGATDLAINILTNCQKVIEFLIEWVKTSKQYGDDVRVFQTRLSSQSARLGAFTAFLTQEAAPGSSHYGEMSAIFQRSVSGMIQELELAFDSYQALINKYKIDDLRRGYDAQMSIEDFDGTAQSKARMVAATKKESETKQKAASYMGAAAWGLFRKRKVVHLIDSVEAWNDKLQNFLLCGLCFGKGPKIGEMLHLPALQRLHIDAGLRLRNLVLEDPRTLEDYLKTGWTIGRLDEQPEMRLQSLTTPATDEGAPRSRPVFVEYKEFRVRRGAAGPSEAVIRGVSSLAKLLSQERAPEAGFRTLHCCGVVRQTSPRQRFAFIFDLPSNQVERHPGLTSITTAVSAGFAHRPTLGERFQMAVSLAKSLFQFHSVNWLHKSIRSANVFFVNENGQHDVPRPDFHEPFLVGFEFSRAENDISTTDQDDSLSHNIYRHPDKQGPPEERFDVLHDIYAFGTVLLEIGIWRPLLGFDRRFERMRPQEIKQCLELHATERLPHYMGMEYTEAVLTCLQGTFLNGEHQDVVNMGNDLWRERVQSELWTNVVEKIHKGTTLR